MFNILIGAWKKTNHENKLNYLKLSIDVLMIGYLTKNLVVNNFEVLKLLNNHMYSIIHI